MEIELKTKFDRLSNAGDIMKRNRQLREETNPLYNIAYKRD